MFNFGGSIFLTYEYLIDLHDIDVSKIDRGKR
jgi:hypothetical protein